VRAELDDVALAHRDVDAGYSREVRARADDRAAGFLLEREVAARMIGVMMRVQYV
jgi:hypothetical protein